MKIYGLNNFIKRAPFTCQSLKCFYYRFPFYGVCFTITLLQHTHTHTHTPSGKLIPDSNNKCFIFTKPLRSCKTHRLRVLLQSVVGLLLFFVLFICRVQQQNEVCNCIKNVRRISRLLLGLRTGPRKNSPPPPRSLRRSFHCMHFNVNG